MQQRQHNTLYRMRCVLDFCDLAMCRFWPKTFKLHVRDGDKSDGNVGCDPQEPLKPLKMYKVKIQLRDKSVAVYVNDEQVCSSDRQDRAVYKKAIVYAADPCVHACCDIPVQDVILLRTFVFAWE